MNCPSELPQWEFGVTAPLRMCFKSIHGHCEKSITKLSDAADTLFGGCVTVLGGEL